jgi:23S rRNA pseudouridine955/2504/2580 synthase
MLGVGDVLVLKESSRVLSLLAAGPAPVDILHEDEDLLVLCKPAGLAVHPTQSATEPDLLTMAAAMAPLLGHDGDYHVVNRLDRFTSGVVLLAPGARRTAAFARVFAAHHVDKRYLALVAGSPPDRGIVATPVDGRPARTDFSVLSRGPVAALVLAQPETGRRHQVRQHLASAGHPLLGDTRYGGPRVPQADGALLHAVFLAIDHPFSGKRLVLVAPVPTHLHQAMRALSVAPVSLDRIASV